ncbi:MAG: hypothetical protein V1816_24560 [Pseudomonadota bacterium]
MSTRFKRAFIMPSILLAAVFLFSGTTPAQEKPGFKGWEKDSEYNQLYNSAELDYFKGFAVETKEVVPLPGMDPGVALIVRDSENDLIECQLGPKSFIGDNIGIKKGDRVKVKGVWAQIGDRDVFLASKVKKGDFYELKVRLTKDGTPFWTMSEEQLAQERASQQ